MPTVKGVEFRNALGHFATGVTVVTTLDGRGEPVGITANSFNSVSVDPPMVLWSIARESGKRSVFESSDNFVVNVLSDGQVDISRRFARSGKSRFTNIDWQPGLAGLPLLPDCAARFECRKVYQYDGGDHIIIVGEVEQFDETGREALVFHRGRYAIVDVHPDADGNAPGSYEDDFLMALLMRATYEFVAPFKVSMAELDLSEAEVRVLTFLYGHGDCDLPRIVYGTMLERGDVEVAIDSLLAQGLSVQGAAQDSVVITDAGRSKVIPVLAIAKAHEERVLASYTTDQVFRLKRDLRQLADRSRKA